MNKVTNDDILETLGEQTGDIVYSNTMGYGAIAEQVVALIKDEYQPQDVFSTETLTEWARANLSPTDLWDEESLREELNFRYSGV